jgi:hypothetical protein
MLSTDGFEKNMVIVVDGKNYRVVEVVSRTVIRIDRPWWMLFSFLAWAVARAYRKLVEWFD